MKKKKVAAYARVSTRHKEQLHSYEFQSRYWNEKLANDENYEYVGLYADNGISGKFAKRIPQFTALINECKKDNVDIVFTKSVQRFARNTEELLTIVRELREIGVGIIFEKENINTMNTDSELYFTVAAAVAENDLVRYSDNVSWSIEDRFKKGEYIIPYLYGYVVKNAKIIGINPEEAKVVQDIYMKYATNEWNSSKLAIWLNEQGIVSARGGKWTDSQIRAILRNEKYKGNICMQKTFTDNGTKKVNKGERNCYYMENSHPAIISKDEFDMVQAEMKRRKDIRGNSKDNQGRFSSKYTFSKKILCGNCGAYYRRHAQHIKGEYVPTWVCATHKLEGNAGCNQHYLQEREIELAFVNMLKTLVSDF